MRKLSAIVITFVLSAVGIALAQAQQPRTVLETIELARQFDKLQRGPRCTKFDGTTYSVDATTAHDGRTYRCSAVYDQWMTRTSRVAWVQVP